VLTISDGRPYYYNTRTAQTVWEKPDALKTPAEVRLAKIPWKEYVTTEGRKYWNNSETHESVWTMPQQYKDALQGPKNAYVEGARRADDSNSMALTLQTFIPAQTVVTEDENVPGTEAYHVKEEAKKDFVRLLRKATEIEPTSKWDQVLPLIIKNPSFRNVKDPVERKQLFEDYTQTLQKELDDKEKERKTKVRERFIKMCLQHPDIKHYTRYKTARPILRDETDFKAPKDEDERRELFEEFRVEALQLFEESEKLDREKAMKVFRKILDDLELEPYARWRPTRDLFERKIRDEHSEEDLRAMNEVDYLTVFEDYVKGLESEYNNIQQAEKDNKFRMERKHRETFHVLPL
jgi:pre-mRNA-processing factor 40